MTKGDIVLISFPFTDLSGTKLRPPLILSVSSADITVCFITSQINHPETTDVDIKPTPGNGLKKDSLIRISKIATLDKNLAKGVLGNLSPGDLIEVDINLKRVFQIL